MSDESQAFESTQRAEGRDRVAGYVFTGAPLSKPFDQFGLGTGGSTHAPDEYYLAKSNTPMVAGSREAAKGYAESLHEMASGKKS